MTVDTCADTFYIDYMVENIGILILLLFAEFLAISVAGGDQVFLCPFNLSGYRSEPYLVQQEQHRLVNGDQCGLQKMSDSNLHDDLVDFDLSESYVNSVMLSQTVLNTPVSVMSSQTVLNTPTSGTYGRNGNNGTRKRHLSMPPVYDTVKKLRGAGSINSDLVVGGEREGIEDAESLAQDQKKVTRGRNRIKEIRLRVRYLIVELESWLRQRRNCIKHRITVK